LANCQSSMKAMEVSTFNIAMLHKMD
jgi:hypothetical protein